MTREQKLEEALNTAIYRLCVVENSPNLNSGEKELIRGWIKEGWATLSTPKAEATPVATLPVAYMTEGYGYKRVYIEREAAEKLARGSDGTIIPLYTSPVPAIYELDDVMQRARDFLNQKGSGEERMCVNCGRTRPSSEGRETPHPDCTSPDACTWDMTSDEAWQYWSQKYHDLARTALTDEAVERAHHDFQKRYGYVIAEQYIRTIIESALLAALPSKGEGE
ncbi:hypothetical protein [Nitratireductor rhodophyticola]|uniref:hypothetical protein n=1 Tax=Nitratireductor rhodophyticola TaxID=2854036 RepID=UPI003BAB46E2